MADESIPDPAADRPILDLGAMQRLEEWGGPTLKLKMIELFLDNAPERVKAIREGLTNGDLELAERSAHSLKSSAANLGAEVVRVLAARIEEVLEGGDGDAARDLLPKLEASFEKTVAAMNEAGSEVAE